MLTGTGYVLQKLKMNRITIALLLLLSAVQPLLAQKKEISQARSYVKSGKDLDKAVSLMDKLLETPSNRTNDKIWFVRAEAMRAQYEQLNEKMYLKQQADTAQFFNYGLQMFRAYESLDSVAVKGGSEDKYRKKYSALLDIYRPNLFSGGSYNLRRSEWRKAYDMYDAYIATATQPFFTDQHYSLTTEQNATAAFWTVYCGYKLQDHDLTLRHADLARRDTAHLENLYRYLCETYRSAEDSEHLLAVCHEALERFPDSPYLVTILVDDYNRNSQPDSAFAIVNRALEINDTCRLFLYAKANLLLNYGSDRECVAVCDRLIELEPDFADAYYDAGLAYVNLAVAHKAVPSKRKKMLEYYSLARPYMERYRQLAPNQAERWARPLYNIYLELNQGKEFVEIERIMKELNQ